MVTEGYRTIVNLYLKIVKVIKKSLLDHARSSAIVFQPHTYLKRRHKPLSMLPERWVLAELFWQENGPCITSARLSCHAVIKPFLKD